MRILLTDGSSLSSRQSAGLLHRSGHRVDTLGGAGFGLAAMTHAIGTRHRTPGLGADPVAWVREALRIARAGRYDVLLPTQEAAAALSACADLVADAGVRTAVPDFAALAAVQDKAAAATTLAHLGIPTPSTTVITGAQLASWDDFPVFVKQPIATGSTGVVLAHRPSELPPVGPDERVVLQAPARGPLLMAQTVWCRGELVAAHANERLAEGSGGGASRKRSVADADVVEQLRALGGALDWHGALSADLIRTPDGPLVIDVNPRMVEPANAAASGVDLLGALLEAASDRAAPQPPSQPGVLTHQTLLAIVGAAAGGTRRQVAAEAAAAIAHRREYRGSREELTPLSGGDWRSGALLATILATLLIHPASWHTFTDGTVSSYALTPGGWAQLLDYAARDAA